jgi:hypothetical protein
MNQSLLQTLIEPQQLQPQPQQPPQQQEQPQELIDVGDEAQGEVGTVTKYAMPNIVPPKTVTQHIHHMLKEEKGAVQ